MKKWTFKDTQNKVIWETSVKEYAEEFKTLLEEKGIEYVVTVQE